jgi:hypothetical protein
MASVASSREEQYPQLKPYRFPVDPPGRSTWELMANDRGGAGIRGGGVGSAARSTTLLPPAAPAISAAACGTCSFVRHLGQSTKAPACVAAADSFVRHTAQSKTIIAIQVYRNRPMVTTQSEITIATRVATACPNR